MVATVVHHWRIRYWDWSVWTHYISSSWLGILNISILLLSLCTLDNMRRRSSNCDVLWLAMHRGSIRCHLWLEHDNMLLLLRILLIVSSILCLRCLIQIYILLLRNNINLLSPVILCLIRCLLVINLLVFEPAKP